MAIAPSKLGRFVSRHGMEPDSLLRKLREAELLESDSSDDAVRAAVSRAIEEHEGLLPGHREYNSPEERVRVFLEPCLNEKGRRWAVPLESLKIPDE